MREFTVEIKKRNESGSSAARRFRRQGLIPAVVYYHGKECQLGLLPYKEFVHLAEQAQVSQIFRFKSDDKDLNDRSAIVREIQNDYIAQKVTHVDFQAIKDDEDITVRVQLKIIGEAPGVKVDGGVLSVAARELAVACLPKLIPDFVEVDISSLKIGMSIHAKDLKLPTGVKLRDDADETIVSVVQMRVIEETPAPTAAVAVEGAEGAATAEAAGAEAGEGKEAGKGDGKGAEAGKGKDGGKEKK